MKAQKKKRLVSFINGKYMYKLAKYCQKLYKIKYNAHTKETQFCVLCVRNIRQKIVRFI